MKILTGNDLRTGAVVWWDGEGWSLHVEHAVDPGEEADLIAAREEAACHVNGPYAIEAEQVAPGKLRPAHIKDRIRAVGPSVRPDLAIAPQDPSIGNWVI